MDRYETPALQLMAAEPSVDPEIGASCFIVGNAAFKTASIVEIGKCGSENMVRVTPTAEAGTRVFTHRKNGRWIEKGEAAKCGTPLIIYPR